MMLDRVRSWLPGAQKKDPPPPLEVSGAELLQWVRDARPLTLLDVRDQKSYRAGHVKGSTLIPGGELQQRMHELRTDRMIVVLAEGDAKAVRAVRMLRNAALDAVHLKGGVGQWPGKMVK